MAMPAEHRNRYIYHFTCLENLPGILEHGLLCMAEKQRIGQAHRSIASHSIQERRSKMAVTCGPGGCVHDYVPFYFCTRSSMLLAVVKAKNVDQQLLIYFAYPIDLVERNDVVFTDASANTEEPPNFYSDPADLVRLNWPAIDSLKWRMSSDAEKQARMAELLVHKRVDVTSPSRIVVWNEGIRDAVTEAYKKAGLQPPPIVSAFRSFYVTKFASTFRDFYVTKFAERKNDETLVTGPRFMLRECQELTKDICEALETKRKCGHERLCDLRNALRGDLSNVRATAQLVGLATSNPFHHQTVGDHTLQVVANLRALPEFTAMDRTDKLLTEIAAYLHDVGKGPKSRWQNRGGIHCHPDADHPIQGLRIVAELLKSDVKQMRKRSVRVILMLVCYHDLIGGITNRGRHKQQLFDVVTDMRDFDMLATLGKADSQALSDEWWDEDAVADLREEVQAHLDGDGSADDDEELDA